MTALKHFAAVPERAAGDKKLAARELRVLLAICRAVDRNSGVAKISQARISERASLARQKISAATTKLERLGYLERVGAGQRKNGHQPVAQYRIVYDTPTRDSADPTTGDTVSATTMGDTARAPTAVTGFNTDSQRPEPESNSEVEVPWDPGGDDVMAEWDRLFGDLPDPPQA
jgi:DNA-binding Lrp family transcriptional regulator